MTNILMYIPNDDTQKITPYVDYNQWLKRLDTQLTEPTNKNSQKEIKFFQNQGSKGVRQWPIY